MPNIDSRKAELLKSLLIAMVIVFPWEQRSSLNTPIATKNICSNYELEIFYAVELLHNSFVAIVTVVTIATR